MSEQQIIHEALTLAEPRRERLPEKLIQCRLTMDEECNHTLSFLNWLSNCVVPGPHESAAVALSVASNKDVVLHIAVSTGIPTQSHRSGVEGAIRIMRSIYTEPDHREKDINRLVKSIIIPAWSHFVAKVALIRTCGINFDGFSWMVDAWVDFRRSRRLPDVDTTRRIVDLAQTFANGDTIAMLKQCFSDIVTTDIPKEPSQEYFMFIAKRCSALLASDFIQDAFSRWTQANTFIWVIYRRLWRVRFFYAGVRHFVTRNRKFLRGYLTMLGNPGSVSFSVHWVADFLPHLSTTYTYTTSPRERSVAMIVLRDRFDLDLDMVGDFIADLESRWQVGDSTCLRLHPEIQMMQYLDQQRLSVLEDSIGTSKPLCDCCAGFVEETRPPFVFTPATQRREREFKADWLVPSPLPGAILFDTLLLETGVKKVSYNALERFTYDAWLSKWGIFVEL